MSRIIFALLVLAILFAGVNILTDGAFAATVASQTHVTIFEDGSWAIGTFPYPVSGCLPWGLCN